MTVVVSPVSRTRPINAPSSVKMAAPLGMACCKATIETCCCASSRISDQLHPTDIDRPDDGPVRGGFDDTDVARSGARGARANS